MIALNISTFGLHTHIHMRLCRTLYKLLKCTCLHCFKLKMLDAEVSAGPLPCHQSPQHAAKARP